MRVAAPFAVLILVCAGNAFTFHHRRLAAYRSCPYTRISKLQIVSFGNIDKDVYGPSKVKGQEFDTVIIGSGVGGLSTACLLAKQGQKVCVLEQHYVAGGAMHTFKSKGYRFATGIHYVGEMGESDDNDIGLEYNAKTLMDFLTPENDPVVWDRMNDHFETAVFGDPWTRHEIIAGEDQWKLKLKERFPTETRGIDKYFELVKKARRSLQRAHMFKAMPFSLSRVITRTGLDRFVDKGYHKWSQRTVKQVLQKLTTDKELQAVLAYNYGDYGVEPSRAPFVAQAFCASHYLNGAYYPRGGPSEIVKRVIRSINSYGGKVLVSAPVKAILINNTDGSAAGVELEDGCIIRSKAVVSDAGLINTVKNLLPPDTINLDFAKDFRASFGQLRPSTTGFNLFVGLKGDHKSLRLPESQYWIYPSTDLSGSAARQHDMSLDQALKMNPRDISPVFVGIPSTKDKHWAHEHPDRTGIEIIMFAPWHWFEEFASFDKATKSHGFEYESVKRILAEKLWTRVSLWGDWTSLDYALSSHTMALLQVVEVIGATGAKLPAKLSDVDHFEVGSPLTFAHYYHSEHGSFFGLDHDRKRLDPSTFYLRLRPEVPEVAGLYLTGQDVAGAGMVNAMAGGLLCAQKVLGLVNPLSLLHARDMASKESGIPSVGVGLLDTM